MNTELTHAIFPSQMTYFRAVGSMGLMNVHREWGIRNTFLRMRVTDTWSGPSCLWMFSRRWANLRNVPEMVPALCGVLDESDLSDSFQCRALPSLWKSVQWMCFANIQTLYKQEANILEDEECDTCSSGRAVVGTLCPSNILSVLSRLQCVLIGPVHSYLHYVLKTCSAKDQTNCQGIFLSGPVYKR